MADDAPTRQVSAQACWMAATELVTKNAANIKNRMGVVSVNGRCFEGRMTESVIVTGFRTLHTKAAGNSVPLA